MRLKSLRKERPAFESEGAVINGNRLDLSANDLKPTRYRPNTSFVIPASHNFESSSRIISAPNTHPRQPIVIPTVTQPVKLPTYQDIETAYLEHGIRIRVSPTRTNQPSGGRKSTPNLQRHSAFISRNPTRTSSVLHYTIANLNEPHDSRSFSALQQTSSDDFDENHTHYVSPAQSSQVNEETNQHEHYVSPSIVVSEHSNSITPEKLLVTNDTTSSTALLDNDPDLAYMSVLLRKQNGDAFTDTIRRRAGLRPTLSAYRNPLTANFIPTQPRDKTPPMSRQSLARGSVSTAPSIPSSTKIDKDIIKHASRIRRMSPTKDQLTKSTGVESTSTITSPIININKQQSTNKPSKSMSLEPLAFLLSPTPRSNSITTQELPTMKQSSKYHKSKTSTKRVKSSKIPLIENPSAPDSFSKDHFTSSTILNDESLSLMRTSPLDIAHQSNSFDSGYDQSSSGDLQSLASSSIMQIQSSLQSTRFTNSVLRRSTANKKVSFYDEPKAIVVTTATYV